MGCRGGTYKASTTSKHHSRSVKLYIYIDTVKELWEEIKKNCTKQNNDWRLHELNMKSIQVKQGE